MQVDSRMRRKEKDDLIDLVFEHVINNYQLFVKLEHF